MAPQGAIHLLIANRIVLALAPACDST